MPCRPPGLVFGVDLVIKSWVRKTLSSVQTEEGVSLISHMLRSSSDLIKPLEVEPPNCLIDFNSLYPLPNCYLSRF